MSCNSSVTWQGISTRQSIEHKDAAQRCFTGTCSVASAAIHTPCASLPASVGPDSQTCACLSDADPPVTLPYPVLNTFCPPFSQGARTMLFKRSELEIFARFGECAPWNGLTERLTLYADDARSVVCEVREWFSRRKDKLLERRSYPKEECTMVRAVCVWWCLAHGRVIAVCIGFMRTSGHF